MNYHKYITSHNIDDSFFFPEVQFFTQTLGYMETLYHGHSFYEVFYILSGNITHVVNGKTEKLSTGDIVFLRPGDCHMFTNDHSDDFLHTDILIKTPLFNRVMEFLNNDKKNNAFTSVYPYKTKLDSLEITMIEKSLQKITSSSKENSIPLQQALISHLLCLAIKNDSENDFASLPLWLKQLLSLFQGGDAISKTKEEAYNLLSTLTYNKSYISRAFKKYMGKTFTEYLNDIRFTNAYTLLSFSDEPIDSIMYKIGITNRSFFYKEIKNRFNATPSNLRKNNSNVNHQ